MSVPKSAQCTLFTDQSRSLGDPSKTHWSWWKFSPVSEGFEPRSLDSITHFSQITQREKGENLFYAILCSPVLKKRVVRRIILLHQECLGPERWFQKFIPRWFTAVVHSAMTATAEETQCVSRIQLSINSFMYQPPPNFHLWWRKQGPESAVVFHILEDSPLPLTLSAQKPVWILLQEELRLHSILSSKMCIGKWQC